VAELKIIHSRRFKSSVRHLSFLVFILVYDFEYFELKQKFKIMKLYAIAPALVAANFEWTEENLGIFQCKEPSEPNWQLPQDCGNQCSEDDKTYYS